MPMKKKRQINAKRREQRRREKERLALVLEHEEQERKEKEEEHLRQEIKHLQDKLAKHEQAKQTAATCRSKVAKRQSLGRARKAISQQPAVYADTVEDLITKASPRKKDTLIPCVTHTIHLTLKDAMKAQHSVSDAVAVMRTLVFKVNNSQPVNRRFKELWTCTSPMARTSS